MQKRKNKNLTLPDLVVLSLLSEKPMHGYYIVNQLEVRDAKDWAPVSRPQVYYSLKKLLGMKLIYNDSNGESSLGPERVQYHIGKTGEEALNHALSSEKWASQRSPSPFMTWMGLSSNLSKKTTRRLIALRKSFLEKELIRERTTLKDIKKNSDHMTAAAMLMVSFTIQQFEAEIKWLDTVDLFLTNVRK
ncbi:MAG TPA: PadR family transcriptional regulator [Bacteriovoracaceae bacterium]|nr:PadR family transcriptional regulator [Bacteriovoracaceae bacterium]